MKIKELAQLQSHRSKVIVTIVRRNTLFVATLLVGGLVEWTFAEAKDGASTPAVADKVAVGDANVTGAHLKPFTNLWKMTQQKPDGPAGTVGTWSDALETVTFQGRPAMKRTQIAKYDKKNIELCFVSVFDPKTMEPFSFDYSRSDNGNVRHVEFQHAIVTYRHIDSTGSKPEEATAKLGQPVFDFYGGMYGLLISSLPLKDGYAAEIPTFDTTTMAIDWVSVRVKRRDTVEAGAGKKAETWMVETPTRRYGRMTWWVTKEPPYVIKAKLEVPENEDGSGKLAAIITYTMV